MAIKINWKDLEKRIINWQEVEKVMLNGVQIRPEVTPPTDDCLCFTANTSSSTVSLNKMRNPAPVEIEYSYDNDVWYDYTFSSPLILANAGDKVYMRNKSETVTAFSDKNLSYYYFSMTGSISASWSVNYLLCKNGTNTLIYDGCFLDLFGGCTSLTTPPSLPATTLTDSCYYAMFLSCTWLLTPPKLPATTLTDSCYFSMFSGCTSLSALPELSATALTNNCYLGMFNNCTSIKLSETQTWEYQTPYRIPSTWTWTISSSSLWGMFTNTWWTFTGTPTINTTYYTSNTIIS